MHVLNSKYNKIDSIDIKKSSYLFKLLPVKTQVGKNTSLSKKLDGNAWYNMKTRKLTQEDEKVVYKIVNRDVLETKNMNKVELGNVFQIGQFVNGKKKKNTSQRILQ